MRILHIITSLELGGAEKLLSELIPLQKRTGYDVELMVLSDVNPVFKKEIMERGVNVYISKYNSKKSPMNILGIIEKIREGNYDIVHAHLVHAQYWTRMARILDKNKNRKYITTEHSTSNRRRGSVIFKVIDKFIFGGYDKIVCISEATQKSLKEWIGGNEKRYVSIANGIDLSRFEYALPIHRDEMGVEETDIVLMMVSRFQAAKNQKGVVEALKYLPEEYKLVFAGDGPLLGDVRGCVRENGLDERVRFLGLRKDIPSLFMGADIVIQLSFFEGFGITAVEGMAAGKPVIASDVPGLAEVVRGAGFLCPADDSKKLAEIILSLRDKKLYDETKEKCLERSKKFTIENSAEEYLKLYDKILEG